MPQRNLFRASQMPTMDRDHIWNPSSHDPHLQLGSGNGSFVVPMDGAAGAIGSRPNDHPSYSFSGYMATNSGPLHDPYFHPSSTASSSRLPPDQVLGMPLPGSSLHEGRMVNPHTEIRSAYKRKSPAAPQAFSGGSISRYYCAGSSSNLQIPSDPLQPRPQYCLVDPASITQSYRSDSRFIAGEDSQRNVRSRYSHNIHPEINPAPVYVSNNVPTHFHAAGTWSAISMERQLSHVPAPMASQGLAPMASRERNLSSDPCFNYEGSQSFAGPGFISTTVGSNAVFHQNHTQSRNTNPLLALHHPIAIGIGTGSIGYSQRSNSHQSSSSYTSVGSATASLEGDGGPPRMESIVPSRYSRPLSITRRSSHRNGRVRNSYSRFQSGYDEDGSRSRWSSQAAAIIDRETYYDSRNWFDQHQEMRLDIDSMSYEELLALEERIGNVSMGLPEKNMSSCLQEITHCLSSPSDSQEGGNCVICLEEYKDRDRLGRLSCGHEYHVSCIKNWLLIKNACPICKAAAFSDSPKEKQT